MREVMKVYLTAIYLTCFYLRERVREILTKNTQYLFLIVLLYFLRPLEKYRKQVKKDENGETVFVDHKAVFIPAEKEVTSPFIKRMLMLQVKLNLKRIRLHITLVIVTGKQIGRAHV